MKTPAIRLRNIFDGDGKRVPNDVYAGGQGWGDVVCHGYRAGDERLRYVYGELDYIKASLVEVLPLVCILAG